MSISSEKEKPWVKTYCEGKPNYTTPVHAIDIPQECVDETAKDRHISYLCPNCHWSLDRQPDHLRDATKKVWVGLTDEEIMEIVGQIISYRGEYMVCVGNAIEAKLKEKNT